MPRSSADKFRVLFRIAAVKFAITFASGNSGAISIPPPGALPQDIALGLRVKRQLIHRQVIVDKHDRLTMHREPVVLLVQVFEADVCLEPPADFATSIR
jgi:hypothetical protein